MKKKLLAGLAVGVLVFGVAGVASATSFSSEVDFSASGTYLGATYSEITDSNSIGYVGSYNHVVSFSPDAATIDSASLSITFANANELLGNGSAKEVWYISDTSSILLGQLTAITDDLWHTQTFTLAPTLYSGVSGSSWSIGFKFNETTQGTDTFYLDKSVLSGDYTEVSGPPNGTEPVPEPATMLLMGTGLAGLAAAQRRRKAKKS